MAEDLTGCDIANINFYDIPLPGFIQILEKSGKSWNLK